MPDPPIWDDEYTGPRWKYGLSYRPVGYAQVPSGWIIKSNRPHAEFRFGTVDWPRELTDLEREHAELTLVSTPQKMRMTVTLEGLTLDQVHQVEALVAEAAERGVLTDVQTDLIEEPLNA